MTTDDRERFSKAVGVLAEATRQQMSRLLLEAYFTALDDLTIEDVERGVLTVLRTHKFATLPLPAEIREAAQGSTADAADAAWGRLLQGFRDCGRYGDPKAYFSERTYAAMRDTFGDWHTACDMSTEGPERLGYMKQFKAAYASGVRRAEQDHYALTVADLPKGLQAEMRSIVARLPPKASGGRS